MTSKTPTMAEFLASYQETRSLKKTAEELNTTYHRVNKLYGQAREAGEIGDTAREPKTQVEMRRLKDRNTALAKQLRELQRDNLDTEYVRRSIFQLKNLKPQPPRWLVEVKKGSGITGVPATIWSDWHLGERVSLTETNGINEYNFEIAERRIRELVSSTLDLCFSHMTNPNYPGIVVNLIGDIVSGEIHEELAETNEAELFPTMLWAVEALIWALSQLADHFGRVFVACAAGNHGRTTHKPRNKRYHARNADWVIYNMLQSHFESVGDDRIQFQIPETGECLYQIYGHRYMAVHGDDLGVRGGDGIIGPIGPIMRGEIKMRHSQAEIGRDYDTLLMGHWHNMIWLRRAIVNNTLKGYDEFARRSLRAVPSTPSQALWFNHPTWGITAQWEVFVEKPEMGLATDWLMWEETGDTRPRFGQ